MIRIILSFAAGFAAAKFFALPLLASFSKDDLFAPALRAEECAYSHKIGFSLCR